MGHTSKVINYLSISNICMQHMYHHILFTYSWAKAEIMLGALSILDIHRKKIYYRMEIVL